LKKAEIPEEEKGVVPQGVKINDIVGIGKGKAKRVFEKGKAQLKGVTRA